MNTAVRWQTPWPQWRSHWQVLHAWPPGAQWLLLSLLSLCMTAAGSWWWSSEAWETWWQAEEQLQQLDEEIHNHQQQVNQWRERIQQLQALPHPSGWAVPATDCARDPRLLHISTSPSTQDISRLKVIATGQTGRLATIRG